MSDTPNLNRDEELTLARAWRDRKDERARTKILAAYKKMAVGFARRSLRPGGSLDDLVQEAQIGLVTALDRFDPDLGFGFSTFARYHVLSRLQVHALENLGPVRIFNTAATKTLLGNYFRVRRELEDPGSGRLSEEAREKLCIVLEIPREQLDRFEMTIAAPAGVDTGAGMDPDEEGPKAKPLVGSDDPERTAVRNRAQEQAKAAIYEALKGLDPRDAEIIKRRHLKDPGETLDAIAADMGVSRERIRQIETRGMRRIKEALTGHGVQTASDFYDA